MMDNRPEPLGIGVSFLLFFLPGVVFWLHLNITIPYLAIRTSLGTYPLWLIIGSLLLFVPIFLLTFALLKRDGYSLDSATLVARLRLRRPGKRDWSWIVGGLLVAAGAVAGIVGILSLLPFSDAVAALGESSPIDAQPLTGPETPFVLLLPVLFFFNYVGEELLWRGYILPRQEHALGNRAWIVNGLFHAIFHFSFGLATIVVSLPIFLLIPLVAQKTQNTTNAIIIHALLGAPIQTVIALGILI